MASLLNSADTVLADLPTAPAVSIVAAAALIIAAVYAFAETLFASEAALPSEKLETQHCSAGRVSAGFVYASEETRFGRCSGNVVPTCHA